jgi:hypothetical protein
MGAWGTGISSNDTYADIYEQFIDLYNEGLSVPEITKRLTSENKETLDIPEDANNFWFAVANGQCECKALDNEIFLKVEQIIQSGYDLQVWNELEASPADLKAREKALNNFLTKLQTEKEKRENEPKRNYIIQFSKREIV